MFDILIDTREFYRHHLQLCGTCIPLKSFMPQQFSNPANPDAHEHARARYRRENLRFERDLVETYAGEVGALGAVFTVTVIVGLPVEALVELNRFHP
jgi:cysteine synthase